MEEIYRQDRIVHIGPTLSSMSKENNAANENSYTSISTTSICDYQNTLNSLKDDTIRSEREVTKQFRENESERCINVYVM